MTPRRRRYLEVVDRLAIAMGVQPTYREVALHLGVGPSAVADMVVQLERVGWVRTKPGCARSLRVTDAGRAVLAQESNR